MIRQHCVHLRPWVAAVLLSAFGAGLPAATVVVETEVIGPTPDNLAYNLAHFYPDSNVADWWRYARVSGARIFLAPSHFNVGGWSRPGDAEVVDEASFAARRAALRADPLNADYINWPIVLGRFQNVLSGNNVIQPDYALRTIHGLGGRILVQANLTESSFPINGEGDWAGKWLAWRTFYALAFHVAREFDVERFAQHNEPNHPDNAIDPTAWLMRVRLCSDAVDSALADVNALYGKSLTPRFVAPVTAGTTYSTFGRPVVSGIRTNLFGQTSPSYRLFDLYAYQQYTTSVPSFISSLASLRNAVAADLPSGTAPLRFALTEFNQYTGANYDETTSTSDALSRTLGLAQSFVQLTAAGMEELYLFKFGMTSYNRNFPVAKNGMLYADNTTIPFNYGTMTRGAEAWRLFNKGLAPGRERLRATLSGTGATSLDLLVSRDPEAGVVYLYSVNNTGGSVPLEIDLSALNVPDGQPVLIEDVSQWRRGTVRSLETVMNGVLSPGSQPGQTVWLITLPLGTVRPTGEAGGALTLPVTADAMVRDGSQASVNFGSAAFGTVRNDPVDVSQRAATFLQFDLPPDWHPDDLLLAVLAVPMAGSNGGPETIHAHLYGLDQHDWDESTLTWATAPNLRSLVAAGNLIRHGVVRDAGRTAHILGQVVAGATVADRLVDVTEYVVRQQTPKASFLLTQDPRWNVDIHVTSLPASWSDLPSGDTQVDGISIVTREGATSGQPASRLLLYRRVPTALDFGSWLDRAFPETTDPAVVGPEASPAGDGLPNLVKFALGLDPATPAGVAAPRLVLEGAGPPVLRYSVNRLARGVVLQVEQSDDLVTWSPAMGAVVVSEDDAQQVRELALSATGDGPFVRLRAEIGLDVAFAVTQNFDALATAGGVWQDDVTLPGWFANRTTYGVTEGGAATTGAMYAYRSAATAPTDYALGGQPNLDNSILLGLRLPNTTGRAIDEVLLGYAVEQWRRDVSPNTQVVLRYQIFPAGQGSLTAATGWTEIQRLTAPVSGAAGALNGNDFSTAQTATLRALAWASGQDLWLQWTITKTSGSNIHLALDDVTLTAVYAPE